MKALIDGDILKYEIGFAAEVGWQTEDELPPWEYVASLLEMRIANICVEAGADKTPLIFLSGPDNFRYELAVTKPYKGTRKDNKPYHYYNIEAYMKGMYEWVESTGMEADDLMCIYQVMDIENTIICTRDKDLRQCPGWHYGWEIGRQAQFGPELADKQGWIKLDKSGSMPRIKGTGLSFFYAQCLTGDAVDNIPGIPQCGPVKAYSILSKAEDHKEMFDLVIEQYTQRYGDDWKIHLTEQGRLLWMVRRINNDGTSVMWNIGDTE